jgi:hypothetical protein
MDENPVNRRSCMMWHAVMGSPPNGLAHNQSPLSRIIWGFAKFGKFITLLLGVLSFSLPWGSPKSPLNSPHILMSRMHRRYSNSCCHRNPAVWPYPISSPTAICWNPKAKMSECLWLMTSPYIQFLKLVMGGLHKIVVHLVTHRV